VTCRNAILVHAVLILASACTVSADSAQEQTVTTSTAAPPYRIIQVVSTNMAEQKINQAAAEGYRVVAFQPTSPRRSYYAYLSGSNSSPSGVTILLHRTKSSTNYEYRLVWAKNGDDFKKSLNEFGGQGYRVLPSSFYVAWVEQRGFEMILWPSDRSHQARISVGVPLVLMEKSPRTVKYAYELALKKSRLDTALPAGYRPVAGDFLQRFLVLECDASIPFSQRPLSGAFHYKRLATFRINAKNDADITADLHVDLTTPAANLRTLEPADDSSAPTQADYVVDKGVLAGERLVLLSDGFTKFMETPVVETLTEAGAPDTPSAYEILLRSDFSKLELAIQASAARGNRLYPQFGVAAKRVSHLKTERKALIFPSLDVENSIETLAVMAVMYPASGETYSYRLLAPDALPELLKQLNQSESDGFDFVLMDQGIAVVEKAQRLDTSAGAPR
jgi:hypothetical protein